MRRWRSVATSLVNVAAMLTAGAAVVLAGPEPAMAAPIFKAPFRCGQRWTFSHHSAEVR